VLRHDLHYLLCYDAVSWFRCLSPGFRHRRQTRSRNRASSSELCLKNQHLKNDFLRELRFSVLSAVTLYQVSILSLILIPLLSQGRAGERGNLQTKQCTRITGSEHRKEKFFQTFYCTLQTVLLPPLYPTHFPMLTHSQVCLSRKKEPLSRVLNFSIRLSEQVTSTLLLPLLFARTFRYSSFFKS
jgi:hypothetical protein